MPVPFILHCNVTVTVPPIPLQDWLQSADANVVMESVLRVTVDGLKWYIRSREDYSTKFCTENFHSRPSGGGGEGRRVHPLYKPYRYVLPQRVGFLLRFGLKMGTDFAHFCLESDMIFKGTTGVNERIYFFNSKWVRKKEKYANSKWILRNLFCSCFNLSSDDIIS